MKDAPKAEAPPAPMRCGVCGSGLVKHRVFAQPDSWVCVKSGCPAWRWDGKPAPPAPVSEPSQPKSEPPIDFDQATAWAKQNLGWRSHRNAVMDNVAQTILALTAERDALKAQNVELRAKVARYEDLIASECPCTTDKTCYTVCGQNYSIHAEARVIRAAREGAK